jgi:hypothetical protein
MSLQERLAEMGRSVVDEDVKASQIELQARRCTFRSMTYIRIDDYRSEFLAVIAAFDEQTIVSATKTSSSTDQESGIDSF